MNNNEYNMYNYDHNAMKGATTKLLQQDTQGTCPYTVVQCSLHYVWHEPEVDPLHT